jgi:hypothetical protein
MTFSRRWSDAVIFLAALLLALPALAVADTFEIINLGSANSNSVFGIDAAGDVVIHGDTGCGVIGYCYKTYDDGVLSSVSITAPEMSFDDGTPCQPVAQASRGVCNDGREAFGGDLGGSLGLFTGADPLSDEVFGGSVDAIVMNGSGDIAWTDGMNENNYEAIDLSSNDGGIYLSSKYQPLSLSNDPVPEPRTLVLLATGVIGAGLLRRRSV